MSKIIYRSFDCFERPDASGNKVWVGRYSMTPSPDYFIELTGRDLEHLYDQIDAHHLLRSAHRRKAAK